MNERWTAATEELLALAVLRVAYVQDGESAGSVPDDWTTADAKDREDCLSTVRPMLAALADAGLLLPPGGEAHEEYRDYATVGGGAIVLRTLAAARSWHERYHVERSPLEPPPHPCVIQACTVTTWPDGSEYRTPRREVTDA